MSGGAGGLSVRAAAVQRRERFSLLRLRLGVVIADLAVVQGGLLAWIQWNLGRAPLPFEPWLLALTIPLQVLLFHWQGAFDGTPSWHLRTWLRTGWSALVVFAVAMMACLYVTGRASDTPRLAVMGWLLSSWALLSAVHAGAWALARARRRGLTRTVVLVGDLYRCLMVEAQLMAEESHESRPVALVLPQVDAAAQRAAQQVGLPLVDLEALGSFAVREQVDRVLICAAMGDDAVIDRVLTALLPYPVEVSLVPDLTRLPLFCLRIEQEGGTPIINLSASPMRPQDVLLKRLEDLVLASLILVVVAIPMLVIAVLVKCTSPGPVLFLQKRHGLLGQTIAVWKFRTMTVGESRPPELGTEPSTGDFLNPKTASHFRQAAAGDERITPVGRVLRRFSLDELPQFFNVLKGDMSIVGPRPHARTHNLGYLGQVPYLMRRHYVKPGITGLAQIHGARGRTEGAEAMRRRVALDLEYIRRWSLWLDLRIIVSTMLWGFYTDEP